MNKQYLSFRNAWITFKLPQAIAGMLIFTFLILDLVMRIALQADLTDLKSGVFIALRLSISIAVSQLTLVTYQTWRAALLLIIITYAV